MTGAGVENGSCLTRERESEGLWGSVSDARMSPRTVHGQVFALSALFAMPPPPWYLDRFCSFVYYRVQGYAFALQENDPWSLTQKG